MKKIVYYFFAVIAFIIGIILIVCTTQVFKMNVTAFGFLLLTSIGFIFMSYMCVKKGNDPKVLKSSNTNPYMSDEDFLKIQSGELVTIETTDFIYKPNEICYYGSNAKRLIIKNETVGYTGRSSGVSLRLTRGLSYRTGGGRSKAIKEDINYFTEGSFFITNKRLLFTSFENGFEIPLNKLTSMQVYKNGISFQSGSKSYLILVDELQYPYAIANELISQQNLSTGTLSTL